MLITLATGRRPRCVGPQLDRPILTRALAPIRLEIEDESWDAILATNLRGAFLMSQRVARVQVPAGGGAIVHIASIDASGGDGPYASYNASKAALLGLNRTMALELARYGIRSNCVSPGFTVTPSTAWLVEGGPQPFKDNIARIPLQRVGQPEDIVNAALFLASDEASWITGINLVVDGGGSVLG